MDEPKTEKKKTSFLGVGAAFFFTAPLLTLFSSTAENWIKHTWVGNSIIIGCYLTGFSLYLVSLYRLYRKKFA